MAERKLLSETALALFIMLLLSWGAECNFCLADDLPTVNFATALTIPTPGYSVALAVGDFNGDGISDLAVGNNLGGISILLGNGDGTFKTATNIPLQGATVFVAVGDFNGDGKPDLAVAQLGALIEGSPGEFAFGSVQILLGNGDGTFAPPGRYSAGNYCSSLAVADVNHDGKLDLIVTSITTLEGLNYPGAVNVLLGNGDGTFRPGSRIKTGINPQFVAVADFNKDGNPDLAVANDDGTVGIFLGNGDGTFQGGTSYKSGGRPASIVIGDFNGDRKPDLAVANFNTATVSIFLGKKDGTFSPPRNYPAGLNNSFSIAAGDFNGDGKLDLAVADYSGDKVQILLGKGNGVFGNPIGFGTGPNAQFVAVGDFNHDGRPDLATADPGGSVSVLLNTTISRTNVFDYINRRIPCDGPWKDHLEYVKSVEKLANLLVRGSLINRFEEAEIVARATASDCGTR